MARRPGHILPFRIPFFRIFYSTTYTTLYLICLCFLAITPISLIWAAIETSVLQYTIMIGGTYVLTASIAIFIYASRLYTNRTVLAGVGKAYIPVEEGEVGKGVRKMIKKQLDRSAMLAWESRPRDVLGEILQAEQQDALPQETMSASRNDYTVGKEIPVDPANPPWGDVQHAGWSSPARTDGGVMPNLQFTTVIAELPNLIEARAVSLAPPDPLMTPTEGPALADPLVVDLLRRPQTMGVRDYLAQLSYLGLVNPPAIGQSFLHQYENARFGGLAITEGEFKELMSAFAELLAGMTELDGAIVDEIRAQTGGSDAEDVETPPVDGARKLMPSSSPRTSNSSMISPVTARTGPSRNITPYLQQESESVESLGSVVHNTGDEHIATPTIERSRSSTLDSPSPTSTPSDAGSVLIHTPNSNDG